MTKVEVILEQARGLSPAERELLVRLLTAQAFSEDVDDEAGVGKRGLAAWTDSTRGEDWSMFYPQALRDGKGSGSRPAVNSGGPSWPGMQASAL